MLEAILPPWQFYYLIHKQQAERAIREFVNGMDRFDLSDDAKAAVKHGLLLTRGKRVRPILTYLTHDLVGGRNPYIDDLAILAELPHRGSLLEDDIDDNAKQRDGKLPAFYLFGKEATREACVFLYESPRLILASLPVDDPFRNRLLDEYVRLSVRAREGQVKDVSWGQNGYIPSVDEYLQMCEEKCAAFEYAIQVGTYAGGATEEQTKILVAAGNKSATAFQLVDDLLCLRERSGDYGSDISEGKKTLPVVLTVLNYHPSRLLSILSQHTNNPVFIKEAISIMQQAGSIKKTELIAKALGDEAISLVKETFPANKFRRILFSIINYGLKRKK